MQSEEYLFEYYHIGNSVKVSAICSETKIEVSIIVPDNTERQLMQNLAIKKLNFVKSKQ